MQRYQSHKIVEAAKIIETFTSDERLARELTLENGESFDLPPADADRFAQMANGPINGGYLVKYEDGYISWSPAAAFEEGYDLVQPSSGKSKIAGYRELSADEIANMNAIKEHGKQLGELVELMRNNDQLDPRWISIGATNLQQGLMALTRAVAQPEFF